jgi:hypothetical protein
MRSERLTILVTPQEKERLTVLAKRRQVSVGELVRSAVSAASHDESSTSVPTPEQIIALEQAADAAVAILHRANRALDRAETELTKTRAHFDAKAGEVRESGETPRAMLCRALARAQERSR